MANELFCVMGMDNKKINICGMGPGNPAYVLPAVFDCVRESGFVIGAKRHLSLLNPICSTTEIDGNIKEAIAAIKNSEDRIITVLVSGDTGFHSFFRPLNLEFPNAEFNLVPGISTYQYFFAKLGKTYEESWLGSLHGRKTDFIGKLREVKNLFLLTDANHNWKYIAQTLVENGMADYTMYIGDRLSYPDERIITATAGELLEAAYDFSLCSVIVEKAHPGHARTWIGIPDDCFIRGDVPMTKEEIRVIALSKLQIEEADHMVDIGAGTGSVSIEAARLLSRGKVIAVERSAEAIGLIRQNALKFRINNIDIIQGMAPGVLNSLTGINKVFIGGSAGELPSILAWVGTQTPVGTRVVITAVTLDTLQLARVHLADSVFAAPEIIQVAVTRVVRVGNSDMLKPASPVFIISTQKIK